MLPKIALLGRPNVGKSTLFNRLIRSNRAITHDRPGVTRDRMEGVVRSRSGRSFTLIDMEAWTLTRAAFSGTEITVKTVGLNHVLAYSGH